MGSAGCVRLTCSAVRKANTARARLTEANFSAVTASATGDSTETSATCCAKPKCADGKCCIAVARVGRRPSPRLVGVLIASGLSDRFPVTLPWSEPASGLPGRAGQGRVHFFPGLPGTTGPGQASASPSAAAFSFRLCRGADSSSRSPPAPGGPGHLIDLGMKLTSALRRVSAVRTGS